MQNLNINTILNYTIKNGGITLHSDGSIADYKDGFIVSIEGKEKTYNIKDSESTWMPEFLKEFNNYFTIAKKYKKLHVGLWIDGDLLYLDLSIHIKRRRDAINTGINNKQLSIYDVKNNKYINLTKKVYIVYKHDEISDDYIYIKEYDDAESLRKDYNIRNIWNYTSESLDAVKSMINNKYIIISERIPRWA